MCFLSTAFALCFLLRTIIFLYNPISGKYMNNEVFITMGYFIPDIVPTLLQLYIIHTRMKGEEEDKSFINNLYDNEMEEQNNSDNEYNRQTNQTIIINNSTSNNYDDEIYTDMYSKYNSNNNNSSSDSSSTPPQSTTTVTTTFVNTNNYVYTETSPLVSPRPN
eukprot:gene3134-3918_t